MRTERHSLVGLATITVVIGCSGAPLDRTAASVPKDGFQCFTDRLGDTYCLPSKEECEAKRRDRDVSSKGGSDCASQPHAFCFSYELDGKKAVHCSSSEDDCAITRKRSKNIGERTNISRCEEL
jgi:hypothetical protein